MRPNDGAKVLHQPHITRNYSEDNVVELSATRTLMTTAIAPEE
jgi:hypothetical protein